MTDSSDRFMAEVKTVRTHSSHFINLVAEPMEPIHAEVLRLATELEAVKSPVQTECNALRDLFARTGGSRLDYGDFAFRMEGYAAVLSRDGQGGALLREVAKLEKFEDNTIEILGRSFWDVQQLSAAMAAAPITCTRRGGNAGEEDSQCERWRRTSSLARSHAMVQAQISGGAGGVDGETHIAQAHQERE